MQSRSFFAESKMGELSHSEMPNQPNELGGTCRNQEVAHYSCSFHLNGQTVFVHRLKS